MWKVKLWLRCMMLFFKGLISPLPRQPITKKNSDTAYILASGKSINLLTDEDWAEISSSYTVGLNDWLLHEFVPDAYFMESPRDPSLRQCYIGNLAIREKNYERTSLFLEYSPSRSGFQSFWEGICERMKKRLCLFRKLTLPGNDEELKKTISFLAGGGAKILVKLGALAWRKGSIEKCILLCAHLGYKKIVLCGVDLGGGYFFSFPEAKIYPGVVIPARSEELVHKTNQVSKDNAISMVTILKFWREALEGEGVQLCVKNSPPGALSEILQEV